MLHVDIPTLPEIQTLVATRANACVSIYLETTPQTQHIGAAGIALASLIKQADAQLEHAGMVKRERWAIVEQLQEVAEDDDFWKYQANSLAIFATSRSHRSYRLPNKLSAMVQVSDRFHLKPLIRSISVQQHAFVLALAENEARLIEVFSDMPATEVEVADMPANMASAVSTGELNTRSNPGHLDASERHKLQLRKYCRKVDAALRPILSGRHEALILAATEPLLSIYPTVNSYPQLASQVIATSPVRIPAHELAASARPILDARHAQSITDFHALYSARENEGRATSDIAHAARAATFGAIDSMLVDVDEVVCGRVDESTGEVSFADTASAANYGVVDEIAGRTLLSGGKVIGERRANIPGKASLAAVLRYAI